MYMYIMIKTRLFNICNIKYKYYLLFKNELNIFIN